MKLAAVTTEDILRVLERMGTPGRKRQKPEAWYRLPAEVREILTVTDEDIHAVLERLRKKKANAR